MTNKTRMTMDIEVIGRDGAKKGHLELTSGNINFYRAHAKTLTAQYTYQQLISLIEQDIEENEDESDEDDEEIQAEERTEPLIREVSIDFPQIKESVTKSISSIEIDIDLVPAEYQNGGVDELVLQQTVLWVKYNQFSGTGTIWAKGISSVNFQRQGYSVFYCMVGLPKKFRDYLADILDRNIPGCVRKNSDYVSPKKDDWRVSCQVQDEKAWFEEEGHTWKEVIY